MWQDSIFRAGARVAQTKQKFDWNNPEHYNLVLEEFQRHGPSPRLARLLKESADYAAGKETPREPTLGAADAFFGSFLGAVGLNQEKSLRRKVFQAKGEDGTTLAQKYLDAWRKTHPEAASHYAEQSRQFIEKTPWEGLKGIFGSDIAARMFSAFPPDYAAIEEMRPLLSPGHRKFWDELREQVVSSEAEALQEGGGKLPPPEHYEKKRKARIEKGGAQRSPFLEGPGKDKLIAGRDTPALTPQDASDIFLAHLIYDPASEEIQALYEKHPWLGAAGGAAGMVSQWTAASKALKAGATAAKWALPELLSKVGLKGAALGMADKLAKAAGVVHRSRGVQLATETMAYEAARAGVAEAADVDHSSLWEALASAALMGGVGGFTQKGLEAWANRKLASHVAAMLDKKVAAEGPVALGERLSRLLSKPKIQSGVEIGVLEVLHKAFEQGKNGDGQDIEGEDFGTFAARILSTVGFGWLASLASTSRKMPWWEFKPGTLRRRQELIEHNAQKLHIAEMVQKGRVGEMTVGDALRKVYGDEAIGRAAQMSPREKAMARMVGLEPVDVAKAELDRAAEARAQPRAAEAVPGSEAVREPGTTTPEARRPAEPGKQAPPAEAVGEATGLKPEQKTKIDDGVERWRRSLWTARSVSGTKRLSDAELDAFERVSKVLAYRQSKAIQKPEAQVWKMLGTYKGIAPEARPSEGPEASAKAMFKAAEKITYLFDTADFGALVHEQGHALRFMLSKKQMDLVWKGLGAKPGEQLTRNQEEQFAKQYQAFLETGKAPTPEMRSAFEEVRGYLEVAYKAYGGKSSEPSRLPGGETLPGELPRKPVQEAIGQAFGAEAKKAPAAKKAGQPEPGRETQAKTLPEVAAPASTQGAAPERAAPQGAAPKSLGDILAGVDARRAAEQAATAKPSKPPSEETKLYGPGATLWKRVLAGKTDELGKRSPLLVAAKAERAAGRLQNFEQFQEFVKEFKRKDKQRAEEISPENKAGSERLRLEKKRLDLERSAAEYKALYEKEMSEAKTQAERDAISKHYLGGTLEPRKKAPEPSAPEPTDKRGSEAATLPEDTGGFKFAGKKARPELESAAAAVEKAVPALKAEVAKIREAKDWAEALSVASDAYQKDPHSSLRRLMAAIPMPPKVSAIKGAKEAIHLLAMAGEKDVTSPKPLREAFAEIAEHGVAAAETRADGSVEVIGKSGVRILLPGLGSHDPLFMLGDMPAREKQMETLKHVLDRRETTAERWRDNMAKVPWLRGLSRRFGDLTGVGATAESQKLRKSLENKKAELAGAFAEIQQEISKISPADRRQMYELLWEGNVEGLAPHLQGTARKIVDRFLEFAMEAEEAGLLPEGSIEKPYLPLVKRTLENESTLRVARSRDRRIGKLIARLEKAKTPEKAAAIEAKIGRLQKMRDRALQKEMKFQEREIGDRFEAAAAILRGIGLKRGQAVGHGAVNLLARNAINMLRATNLKKRTTKTLEEARERGFELSIEAVLPALAREMKATAELQTMRKVAEDPLLSRSNEPAPEDRHHWVQIPDNKSKWFGLAGKWVNRDIYDTVQRMVPESTLASAFWSAIHGLSKSAIVVGSPAIATTQMVSNPFWAMQSGLNVVGKGFKDIRYGLKQVLEANLRPKEWVPDATIKEMIEQGVLRTEDFQHTAFQDAQTKEKMLDSIHQMAVSYDRGSTREAWGHLGHAMVHAAHWSLVEGSRVIPFPGVIRALTRGKVNAPTLPSLWRGLRTYLTLGDTAFGIALYKQAREGRTSHGMTPLDPVYAGRLASTVLMPRAKIPGLVQNLTKVISFGAFPAKLIRELPYQLMMHPQHGLAKFMPNLPHTSLGRKAYFAAKAGIELTKWHFALAALDGLGRNATGLDDESYDAAQLNAAFMDPFRATFLVGIGTDKNGQPIFLDTLGLVFPWATIIEPFRSSHWTDRPRIQFGRPDSMLWYLNRFSSLGWWIRQNTILSKMYESLVIGETYYGEELSGTAEGLWHMFGTPFTPSLLRNAYKAVDRGLNPRGIRTSGDYLRQMIGLRLEKPSPEKETLGTFNNLVEKGAIPFYSLPVGTTPESKRAVRRRQRMATRAKKRGD